MKKDTIRKIDATFGALARSTLRHVFVHPIITARYKLEVRNMEDGLSIKNGAIVVARHISRWDAAILMDAAWPFARLRPTAWWREYDHWLQKPLMVLFGTIRVGNDPRLPPEVRAKETAKTKEILSKVLRAGWGEIWFAQGGIGDVDATKVVVLRHLNGIHDMVKDHPDKPVLMVQMKKLGRTRFSRRRILEITLTRIDNFSTEGGSEGVNDRLEKFFRNEPVNLSA